MQFQPYAEANNPRVLRALSEDFLETLQPNEAEQLLALHEKVRCGEAVDLEGLSPQYKAYCKENGYDWDKELSWISYVDANSLYPAAMVTNLPKGNYARMELSEDLDERLDLLRKHVKEYDHKSSSEGFFFVVTYEVPRELHDHFDLAPLITRVVGPEELSPYQNELLESFGGSLASPKLVADLGKHVQQMHTIRLLQVHDPRGGGDPRCARCVDL